MMTFRSRAALLSLVASMSLAGAVAPASAQQPASGAKAPAAAPTDPSKDTGAAPSERVVARVDGQPITQHDLDIAAEDMADRLPRVPEAQRREYLLSYLIDLRIGARAAAAAKIGETPEFARKLAYNRDKLLLDDYLADVAKGAATPEATRKVYEQTVKDLKPEEEVRARHILVEKEEVAKAAYQRVKAGEDFAKVAAELSKDPGSAKDGGDLGWFTKDRMVPEFSAVAFKLEPGQVGGPVKTQFGWHVIQVEGRRAKPVPTYADVKDEVEAYVTRKAQQDLILDLRAKAKIERLDEPKSDAKAEQKMDGAKPAAKPAAASSPATEAVKGAGGDDGAKPGSATPPAKK